MRPVCASCRPGQLCTPAHPQLSLRPPAAGLGCGCRRSAAPPPQCCDPHSGPPPSSARRRYSCCCHRMCRTPPPNAPPTPLCILAASVRFRLWRRSHPGTPPLTGVHAQSPSVSSPAPSAAGQAVSPSAPVLPSAGLTLCHAARRPLFPCGHSTHTAPRRMPHPPAGTAAPNTTDNPSKTASQIPFHFYCPEANVWG